MTKTSSKFVKSTFVIQHYTGKGSADSVARLLFTFFKKLAFLAFLIQKLGILKWKQNLTENCKTKAG